MRYVGVVIVVFLVVGCGNYRHHNLEWPARLVSLSDFSSEQHTRVMGALEEFNSRSQKTLVVWDDSKAYSSLFIKWTEMIPKLSSSNNRVRSVEISGYHLSYRKLPGRGFRASTKIVGRATLETEKCTVDITDLVASNDELLKPVLWHELGHCAGLEHDPLKGEIMYKEVTPLSEIEPAAIDRFFATIQKVTNPDFIYQHY